MQEWLKVLEQYPAARDAAYALALILGAWLAFLLTRVVLTRTVGRIVSRTRQQWDDALVNRKVFSRLALLAPGVVVSYATGIFPQYAELVNRALGAYAAVVAVLVADAALSAAMDIYDEHPASSRRPLKGVVQLVKLFLFLLAAIIAAGVLLGQSPWGLVTGLGALSAVLLLIFRDTILSFVAGTQIVANDLFRRGDWIEMPDFGANGDVMDIALHNVRVRNFDKTIVTIPTHKFLDTWFKNWRGMQLSGGRRIMRSVLIDQSSVRFLDEALTAELKRIHRIRDYLEAKERDIAAYNREHGAADDANGSPVNGRRLTNLGTFRAYVDAYLRSRGDIHEDMTFLIRQLEPTPEGLPLQVYVFAKTTDWAEYEAIQADVFDHLLAVLPVFGLRVYQRYMAADPRAEAFLHREDEDAG